MRKINKILIGLILIATMFLGIGYSAISNITLDIKGTVTAKASRILSSIAVTTPPTKTEYTTGEVFDATGMVVTATYSDGSTAEVTGYTIINGDALAEDMTTVTISYTEGGVTVTTAYEVGFAKDPVITLVSEDSSAPSYASYTIDGVKNAFPSYGTPVELSAPIGTEITLGIANSGKCSCGSSKVSNTICYKKIGIDTYYNTISIGSSSITGTHTVNENATIRGVVTSKSCGVCSGKYKNVTIYIDITEL